MLGSPRARQAMNNFVTEWLSLGQVSSPPTDEAFVKDQELDGLRDAMIDEVLELTQRVIFGGGSFATLLMDRTAKLGGPLPSIYGVAGGEEAVELPATERAGLLTRAAMNVRPLKSSPYRY